MNLKELLTTLFTVCLDEEYGSSEHITEHIDCDDLIKFTKNSDDNELKEISKLFKKLKKSYENGDENDKVREKLKRLSSPHKYELIDEIINIISSAQKKLPINNEDEIELKLKGKFKICLINIQDKYILFFKEEFGDFPLDAEDDLSEKDLEYALKKIKESVG